MNIQGISSPFNLGRSHPEALGTFVEHVSRRRVETGVAFERQVVRAVRAGAWKAVAFDRARDRIREANRVVRVSGCDIRAESGETILRLDYSPGERGRISPVDHNRIEAAQHKV